ncbi:MAG: type II toxin-antitoxin system prevent-host-death family antitoxin [Mariprofundaceae bacterium]|nr:type II toxin-antitoxin system prevent-host-death family antitoxin [Mariprofundaceae bacterium]
MRVVSFTEARNGLNQVLNQVEDDADFTVIHRRDHADAVVMGLDYFNSMMETIHLLESPENAKRLMESIKQYKEGKTKVRELLDD